MGVFNGAEILDTNFLFIWLGSMEKSFPKLCYPDICVYKKREAAASLFFRYYGIFILSSFRLFHSCWEIRPLF